MIVQAGILGSLSSFLRYAAVPIDLYNYRRLASGADHFHLPNSAGALMDSLGCGLYLVTFIGSDPRGAGSHCCPPLF